MAEAAKGPRACWCRCQNNRETSWSGKKVPVAQEDKASYWPVGSLPTRFLAGVCICQGDMWAGKEGVCQLWQSKLASSGAPGVARGAAGAPVDRQILAHHKEVLSNKWQWVVLCLPCVYVPNSGLAQSRCLANGFLNTIEC